MPYHQQFPLGFKFPDKAVFGRKVDAIECLNEETPDTLHSKSLPARPQDRRRRRRPGCNLLVPDGDIELIARPSFHQWIRYTWLDLLTMVILGGAGLAMYFLPPLSSRPFPIQSSDGQVVWPQIAYPETPQIIHTWLAALLVTLIPTTTILLLQIRIRSFWDANNAVLGLLYSLILAAVFQVTLKWLIGGFRPQFLEACRPAVHSLGKGFANIMHDRSICLARRSDVDRVLDSFPSGHSTAAFAGLLYLALYLNAKLKIFANYQPRMWKIALFYAPILGATLISGSLVIDASHHWYDVCAGAVIGTLMAFSAFRSMFASVWDARTNHIVLHREVAHGGIRAEENVNDAEGAVYERQTTSSQSQEEVISGSSDKLTKTNPCTAKDDKQLVRIIERRPLPESRPENEDMPSSKAVGSASDRRVSSEV